jgi:hypothetical protein
MQKGVPPGLHCYTSCMDETVNDRKQSTHSGCEAGLSVGNRQAISLDSFQDL